MRITYVTEDTELWGGISIVFQHLELLAEAGHDVFLTTLSGKPDWYLLKVPLHTIERLDPSCIPAADIIVATSWKTVRPVAESKKGRAVHLCQGYEAALKELSPFKSEIEEVYSLAVPILTVSSHLTDFIRKTFNAETYDIGQPINKTIFFPERNPLRRFLRRMRRPSSLLVVGPFLGSYKNIPAILQGICIANRALERPLRLVRVSQFPLSSEEESILRADEYRFRVPYNRMGRIYRSSEMLISLSTEAEGFGLPALEAMACGIPTILSKIPSHLGFDATHDYALFVDSEPEALAEGIREMCTNRELRNRLSKRGLAVTEKFAAKEVLERLVSAFERIISHR